MSQGRQVFALGLLGALLAAVAPAASHRIRGAGETHFDCRQNPSVEIDGTGMTVHLEGDCERIEVDGTGNQVIAEGVGKIELSGLNHQVSYLYVLGGRSRPTVEQNGFGHKVARREDSPAERSSAPSSSPTAAAPAPTKSAAKPSPTPPAQRAAPRSSAGASADSGLGVAGAFLGGGSGVLQLNDDDVRQEVACGGRTVQVNGDRATVKLKGDCPSVQVNGDSNEVWIERIDNLQVNGEDNVVRYVGGVTVRRPRTSDTGDGNAIRSASIEEFDAR